MLNLTVIQKNKLDNEIKKLYIDLLVDGIPDELGGGMRDRVHLIATLIIQEKKPRLELARRLGKYLKKFIYYSVRDAAYFLKKSCVSKEIIHPYRKTQEIIHFLTMEEANND